MDGRAARVARGGAVGADDDGAARAVGALHARLSSRLTRVRRPPGRTSKMGPEEDGSSQEVQCWRQASRGWRRRRAAASMTQGASLASANTLGDLWAGWPHAPRRVRGRRTTTGKSQPVRLRYSVTCDAPPRTAPASCWQVATKQLPREADADVTHVKEAGDEAADGPLDADTRSDDAHAGGRDAVVAEATPTNAANVANVASARILTPARASTSAPPPRTTASDVTTPPRDERASTRRKSESLLLGSEARRVRGSRDVAFVRITSSSMRITGHDRARRELH